MSTVEFYHSLNQHQQALSFFALKLTSDEEDAKDLLQETVFKALRYKDRLISTKGIKSWLYTIMKNTFINNYHREVNKRSFMGRLEDIPVDLAGPSMKSSEPQHDVSYHEIMAVVDALADEFRIPFKMKLEGFKYKEISEELNVPIGTIKSRIFIARKQMMEKLPEYNPLNS